MRREAGIASASVHLAEVGTSLASGAAHWRFGNVDWPMVTRIALPGAAGAVLGAYTLTSLSTEAAAPYMVGLLVVLGGGVLAAPFAAWLVQVMPARLLGTAAGGLIALTNLRIVFDAAGVEGDARTALYVVLGLAWVLALSAAVRALQADRAEAADISRVGDMSPDISRRTLSGAGAEADQHTAGSATH